LKPTPDDEEEDVEVGVVVVERGAAAWSCDRACETVFGPPSDAHKRLVERNKPRALLLPPDRTKRASISSTHNAPQIMQAACGQELKTCGFV